jgi:3',5'-cyclic AMP phosphodiesterase CpdA
VKRLIVATTLVVALAWPTSGAAAEAPRDLYAEAPRPDQVKLSWQAGTTPATDKRYQVFRNGELIAETEELKFTDSWLSEQRDYSYVVRAVDAQGATAESAPVTIKTPPFQAGLEIAPYLQELTSTSVAVVWQTYGLATTGLRFGPAGGQLSIVEHSDELRRDHVVPVEGLAPDTIYRYRWESDGRIGAEAEFRTPPAASPRFSFGVIGDYGVPTPAARANLRRLTQDNIDFAITTGDNAQLHAEEIEYRNYVIEPLRDLIAHKPFWPSIGNHDYENLHNYLRYFALPPPERYYSFSYGGVLFLSLDSNRYDTEQKSWMRSVLRSDARCKVAFFHHPLWSSGLGYRNRVRKRRREKIAAILERGGVDLVLNGHVQNYERSKPLRGGRVDRRRGIVYVVTGGGGAHLNPFVTRRKPRWSARRGVFHHRLRITAVDNRLVGRAIDTGGDTRDRFTVNCR